MEGFKELIKKIKTKEELIFFLEEIDQKKIKGEEVSELERKLRSLPEINLEIAFSPSEDFIDRMSQWLEKELGQKIILDITVNPKIVGGAIIEYQGKWLNFTLARKIDQTLKINEESSEK